MNRPITLALLKGFLGDLGFEVNAVPGSHVAFKHAQSGALIVLRFLQDDEVLSVTDLALTRRILDEFGVLNRDEFESALRERTAVG